MQKTKSTKEETKNLSKQIEKLNKEVKKSNSFFRIAVKGLLYGAATALGATIVAAIVITILAKTIKTVSDIPVVGNIIEKTKVESLFPDQINTKKN